MNENVSTLSSTVQMSEKEVIFGKKTRWDKSFRPHGHRLHGVSGMEWVLVITALVSPKRLRGIITELLMFTFLSVQSC